MDKLAGNFEMLGAHNLSVMLLNTQNIGTERHAPPKKLNKAAVALKVQNRAALSWRSFMGVLGSVRAPLGNDILSRAFNEKR